MSTVKKYKLLKDISFPGIFCKAETESIQWEGYYAFPYEGRCFNYGLEGSGWLGNAYLCMNPQDYPDFFELVNDTVPEEIQVCVTTTGNSDKELMVFATKKINLNKLTKIKDAIEQAINGKGEGVNMKEFTDGYQMGYKTALKYAPEQPSNDNAFLWNDILVKEFVNLRIHDGNPNAETGMLNHTNEFRMRQFKQSKQSKQPLPTDTDKPLTGDDLLVSESRAFYAGADGKHKTFSDYKHTNLNK